jgi:Gpi18-like mannosyltransferase
MVVTTGVISFLEKHSWIELVIFAFALHGMLAPFTGLEYDIQIWREVTADLLNGNNPYIIALNKTEYYAYPPLWAYLLLLMRIVSGIFGNNVYLELYLMKLPLIIAQICSAWIGSLIVGKLKSNPEQKEQGFIFLLLNPFFFLIGSIWGMFDMIPTFFSLLTVYAVLQAQEADSSLSLFYSILAGASLSLAFLAKIYPIILLPVCLLALLRNLRWVWFLFAFVLVTSLVCFPLFILNPDAFLQVFLFHAERIGGGVTYWNGVWIFIAQGQLSIQAATEITGLYIIPFTLTLFLTYLIYLPANKHAFFSASAMVVWVFTFSFKLILEQYCVWILAFTTLYLVIKLPATRIRVLCVGIVTAIPLLYLIISVPFPLLFHIDIINKQAELFNQWKFIEKQSILFVLGLIFASIHFILWIFGCLTVVSKKNMN